MYPQSSPYLTHARVGNPLSPLLERGLVSVAFSLSRYTLRVSSLMCRHECGVRCSRSLEPKLVLGESRYCTALDRLIPSRRIRKHAQQQIGCRETHMPTGLELALKRCISRYAAVLSSVIVRQTYRELRT